MENTYQDLITDIQSKNPKISGKLEGGKKFKIKSDFKPAGDQPEAIKKLVNGANKEEFNQVLLGVTGSGKHFFLIMQLNISYLITIITHLKPMFQDQIHILKKKHLLTNK